MAVAFACVAAACTSVVRASVANDGTQGNGTSWFPSLSFDGRYVAFESDASNLVPGDTNNVGDVFVRDNTAKTIVRASLDSSGQQLSRKSGTPRIDDSGRVVAFISDFWNSRGSTYPRGVYVHDTQTGVTEPISPSDAFDLDLSGSGRYVALVSGGIVTVYDRDTDATDTSAGPGGSPTISDDGRYVAFTRPRPTGSNDATDVFVHDRVAGTTTLVPYPTQVLDPSAVAAQIPQISGNGRYVAYLERRFAAAFFFKYIVYVYDRTTGTRERVDVRDDGTPSPDLIPDLHAISDDGRDVMFRSGGIVAGDENGIHEYVRDRVAGRTYLVDRNANEEIGNDWSSYGSDISGDGSRVAMSSQATNLVPSDTNGTVDVFVRAFPGAPAPPPPSTTTTVPRIQDVRLIPACSDSQPYAVQMRVENFPVEELRNNMIVEYADGSTFTNGWWFTPDSSGNAQFPYVVPNATQPYGFHFDIFVDNDHDGIRNGSDITEGNGFFNISQPCAVP
jgi:Tol biopolymer transport system component